MNYSSGNLIQHFHEHIEITFSHGGDKNSKHNFILQLVNLVSHSSKYFNSLMTYFLNLIARRLTNKIRANKINAIPRHNIILPKLSMKKLSSSLAAILIFRFF